MATRNNAFSEIGALYEAGRYTETVGGTKTVAVADSGKLLNVIADGSVITLPATDVGLCVTIRNGQASAGTVAVNISPNASDKITGCGLAGTDNKDLINTKATSRPGDYVELIADGSDGWFIRRMVGTWEEEA